LSRIVRLRQARVSRRKWSRRILIVLASIFFGAVTFWGMNILLLSAIRIHNPTTGQQFPIDLSPPRDVLALVISTIFAYAGVFAAVRDKYFGTNAQER
jgi:hypothetical protein